MLVSLKRLKADYKLSGIAELNNGLAPGSEKNSYVGLESCLLTSRDYGRGSQNSDCES